jgi:hypothetical protein
VARMVDGWADDFPRYVILAFYRSELYIKISFPD